MNTKVVYLTWGSTPRPYGVFGSQVIRQFQETKNVFGDADFHMVSSVPIVNSGIVHRRLKFFEDIESIKNQLSPISYTLLPIYAPQNFFNSTAKTFRFMHFGAQYHLAKKLIKLRPNIVHCRSYHATYAALKVKEKFSMNYKVIFDARGMWPEEVALKKGLDQHHPDYLFSKAIENWLILNSDVTITVSEPMNEHYLSLGANWSEAVHLSAPIDNSLDDESKEAVSGTNTLCYVGALDDNTWHKPKCLHSLYKKFRSEVSGAKLIIITTSNHARIKKIFSDIPSKEITLTSTKKPEELEGWLKQADFGALSYFNPTTAFEKSLSNSVLAIKTCEYLGAGLPVLVNHSCGGASKLIDKYGVGISYGTDCAEITSDRLTELKALSVRKKAAAFARELFDYRANGERYSRIYRQLLESQ